jgi:putative ABC transport system permease protein
MTITGAVLRGVRNPFRSMVRALVVLILLALVVGFLALMIEATMSSRERIAAMESRVQTLIELREAGAFGTGGFGGDSPIGKEGFTVATLEKTLQIPHAQHLARVDEYVYKPEMDATKGNAYAMIIGTHPDAAMRAIGEVDYENTEILAGRTLEPGDENKPVAVVGKLYAKQRLGIDDASDFPRDGREALFNGQPFQVVGIYTTANDFGDNHVFMPIKAFRQAYQPGDKLSKIFVTVDSVANVEKVVNDLRAIPEADVVTIPESVATARSALGTLSVASAYAAAMLFAIGAVLVVFVMILSTRERIREIGTLKAIGASNQEVAVQFLAEAVAISGLAGIAAMIITAPIASILGRLLSVAVNFSWQVVFLILLGSVIFAALGSLYPVIKGIRLNPIEAMRRT